jgi:hypothetical protein
MLRTSDPTINSEREGGSTGQRTADNPPILATPVRTIYVLAVNRQQLASIYYVYSRSDSIMQSPSVFGGMPGVQECVECRSVVFTPAARKSLDRSGSNEHPICDFP